MNQAINEKDYWDEKSLCALRWIIMLNMMPMLSPASRRDLEGEKK
jgi:hypothetical protein